MAETKKSSAAYFAGLLLGWCFIVALFVMIFYDSSDTVDRLINLRIVMISDLAMLIVMSC